MNNFEKIQNFLKKREIKHRLLPLYPNHLDVESTVKELGIKFKEGLSTLIYKKKNGEFFAVLRRDDKNISAKEVKKVLGTGDYSFCTPEDMTLLGIEIGLGSPFIIDQKLRESNYPIKVYVDSAVLDMNKIICGSCSADNALEIQLDDLLKNLPEYEVINVSVPNPKRQDDIESNSLDSNKKLRVLSGITPSSSKGLHLGNYLGALKPQVDFQTKGECFYFIADYHALNTVYDKNVFSNNVYETYLDYLALGIDLNKTTFFIESHVRAIFELTEILNNVVMLSEMKRMHAYKDKLADPNSSIDNINMGLFTYPILMASDILIFEPDIVPVGEDQTQHVEICRDIAKGFNYRYGEVIKIPDLYVKKEVARVIGTDGVRKMSKSLGNDITIFASEEVIKKQIMSIVTDLNRIHKDDPGDPSKNVLFSYLKLMEYDQEKIQVYEERYSKGTVGDVELKEEFFRFFLEYFKEFRSKREELAKDKNLILDLMRSNAIKANKIAEKTIVKVRTAIGSIYN